MQTDLLTRIRRLRPAISGHHFALHRADAKRPAPNRMTPHRPASTGSNDAHFPGSANFADAAAEVGTEGGRSGIWVPTSSAGTEPAQKRCGNTGPVRSGDAVVAPRAGTAPRARRR